MIALPLTCTFSTGNWQILLTNNLNAAPDWRVHGAHVLRGRIRQPVLFREARFYSEPDTTARRWFQDATSAMNKQISEMGPLTLCGKKQRTNTASRFYSDQDTHS